MVFNSMHLNTLLSPERLKALGELIYKCIEAVTELMETTNFGSFIKEPIRSVLRLAFAIFDLIDYAFNNDISQTDEDRFDIVLI